MISPEMEDFYTLSRLINTHDVEGVIRFLSLTFKEYPENNLLQFFDIGNDTALMKACVHGNIEIERELISYGAGVNDICYGITPLVKAIWYNRIETVAYLIEMGADVNIPVSGALYSDYSPLMIAVKLDQLEITKLLLTAGANVNYQEAQNGSTALMIAAHFDHPEIVRWLMLFGANLKLKNIFQKNAFEIAKERHNLPVVELLLWGPSHDPHEKSETELRKEIDFRTIRDSYEIHYLLADSENIFEDGDNDGAAPSHRHYSEINPDYDTD